jgi:hypothetical protein
MNKLEAIRYIKDTVDQIPNFSAGAELSQFIAEFLLVDSPTKSYTPEELNERLKVRGIIK